MLDIDAIEQRWTGVKRWRWENRPPRPSGHPDGAASLGVDFLIGDQRIDFPNRANAELITSAPTDIAALIAEVRRVREPDGRTFGGVGRPANCEHGYLKSVDEAVLFARLVAKL